MNGERDRKRLGVRRPEKLSPLIPFTVRRSPFTRHLDPGNRLEVYCAPNLMYYLRFSHLEQALFRPIEEDVHDSTDPPAPSE